MHVECCICLGDEVARDIVFQCGHKCCEECYEILTKRWAKTRPLANLQTGLMESHEIPPCPMCRRPICVPLEIHTFVYMIALTLSTEIQRTRVINRQPTIGLVSYIKQACLCAAETYACLHGRHPSCSWCEKREALLNIVRGCEWTCAARLYFDFLAIIKASKRCINSSLVAIARGHLVPRVPCSVFSSGGGWRALMSKNARIHLLAACAYRWLGDKGLKAAGFCDADIHAVEACIFTEAASFEDYFVKLLVWTPIMVSRVRTSHAYARFKPSRTNPTMDALLSTHEV